MKTLRNSVPSGIRKVISIVVIVSMLMSLVGCKKAAATSESNGTSEGAVTASETSSDSSAANGSTEPAGSELSESEATTAAPVSGAYTYTVYGNIQLSMDVNVDDYIFTNESNGYTFFRVSQLAYDLGWLGNDEYNEVDNDNESSYRPGCYTFHSGDLVATLNLDSYHDENLPGENNRQFSYITLTYEDNGGDVYYSFDESSSNPNHTTLICEIAKHYEECNYRMVGEGWFMSYEDIVVMSYILWSVSENPGENPLVLGIGADSDYGAWYDTYVEFSLP
ncbi:MAG: hypothetical protein J6L84_06230 [Clostridiales bacterium]|nr:hypothetical protein [Clostridiales bacterium]